MRHEFVSAMDPLASIEMQPERDALCDLLGSGRVQLAGVIARDGKTAAGGLKRMRNPGGRADLFYPKYKKTLEILY
jgi:hypothetical protein